MKSKIFNLKNGMLACAFLIPFFILGLHYASMDVWPFGENSVLVLDLNGQYVYYFEAFRDIIREGGSLLYTWSRALGGEFMGIFAYYLASPFSVLTALFPDGYITESLLLIFMLKAGACGLTMAFYLSKTQKSDSVKTIIISTMYALSSYAIVQAHNTMWIDELIYLPLLTYAIEVLIKKGRFKMFIIVLALAMMANFYIGYMICIYTALYFFYYYITYAPLHENNFYYEKNHFLKSLIRIASSSLIAVAIAAWVLYPAYYSLTFGKTTFTDPDYYPYLQFSPLDLVSKLFFGSYDTVEPSGWPFVYCGTLMLILLPLYFFSKKISARKKMMGGALLLTFATSFIISSFDLVWHGMQAPNWLNYRYSFMFIFIALVFSHKVLSEIEKEDFRKVIISCASVLLLLFIVHKLAYENIGTSAVIGTVLCVVAMLLALHAVRYGYLQRGAVIILCIIVCVEMFCGAILNTMDLDTDVVISTRDSYNSFIDRLQPMVDTIEEKDAGFYRMEKTLHRKTNDNLTLGIKGLSNSTSTLNASQIDLLQKLGLSAKSHWSKYLGSTPVTDSLLGVKYIIGQNQIANGVYEFFEEDTENNLYAYKNPYALSIAFGVNNDIQQLVPEDYNTPFEYMNAIVTKMLGREETVELFKELKIDGKRTHNLTISSVDGHTKYVPTNSDAKAHITYNIEAKNHEMIYMYIPSVYPREANLFVNDTAKGTYFDNETWRIVELGRHNTGDSLEVKLELGESELLYIKRVPEQYFYYMDTELFTEIMPLLAESSYTVTAHSDTRLKGEINVQKDDTTLFTTIPYDEGWHVKIDGREAKILKTLDSLLAVEITEGKHTIEFVYLSNAVFYGRIFSAVGTVIFAVAAVLDTKMRRRREKSYCNLVDIKNKSVYNKI